jgi:hypothetical protein
MEPFRDDNELAAELRARRPEPSREFATELDERAAAGFPRRSPRSSSPLAGLLSRLREVPARRLAFSAGATALAAVTVATVVIAVSEPQNDSASLAQLSVDKGSPASESPPAASGAGDSSGSSTPGGEPARNGTTHGTESSGVQYGAAVPAVTASESSSSDSASGNAGGGSSSADTGPYAAKAGHRDVERSAEMVLGADPADVAGDAAEVFDAVHAADGIVLSSSVSGGTAGDAGARFDLLIPAAKLSDALADFSAIGTVVSRHEATDDITAPTVRTGEHLRDSRARIDGLLVQLAGTDSDEERAEVEAELQAERRRAAALRSQAAELGRRANLSRVSLRIVTDPAATSSDEGGAWGVDDALDDAGYIIAIAAGVTIVGLAILAPLALIALLAWLANRTRLRRARERALA